MLFSGWPLAVLQGAPRLATTGSIAGAVRTVARTALASQVKVVAAEAGAAAIRAAAAATSREGGAGGADARTCGTPRVTIPRPAFGQMRSSTDVLIRNRYGVSDMHEPARVCGQHHEERVDGRAVARRAEDDDDRREEQEREEPEP